MDRRIKALLILEGIKQKDIAEACGVTYAHVSAVVLGKDKSRRIQRYIADLLREDYHKLWGKAA